MKGKKIMMIALLMLSSSAIYAQMPEIQHDEQKEKQWKSMENGPWDFAPDWYYWLMHNSYSGASTYWAWRGFHSGLHVRFRESDSNVKRIMPVRVTSEETQRQKMKKVEDAALVSLGISRPVKDAGGQIVRVGLQPRADQQLPVLRQDTGVFPLFRFLQREMGCKIVFKGRYRIVFPCQNKLRQTFLFRIQRAEDE